jgi:hypothetical protein
MAYPKLEIYPRAGPLTGSEDVLISQGRVNRKVSTQAIADLAASMSALGDGTVPGWGVLTGFAANDVLAIGPTGALVKASNTSANTMPAIGLFVPADVGAGTAAAIRVAGRSVTLSGLTTGTTYYVGVNGALTTTPPTASGTIAQRVFKATDTTAAFVQLGEPITNA